MPEPRDNQLSYSDPLLQSASVPSSSKPTGPSIIYSPEYIQSKLTNRPSMLSIKPVLSEGVSMAAAQITMNKSLATLFQTGFIDDVLKDGFSEMGKNFTDWASVQKRFNLSNEQLDLLKKAHAKYFGLSTDELVPLALTPTTKKPNYLLLGALALVGLLVVRKILK